MKKSKSSNILDPAERRDACLRILQNGLFVLSDRTCSGKTITVSRVVSEIVKKDSFKILVFTPTGKADLVIKNEFIKANLGDKVWVSTIHKFLFQVLKDAIKKNDGC